MLANKLMSSLSGSGIEEKLYVDDVFSTYLYTGNGATRTINNGIDLAGKGGLVWLKQRASLPYNHALFDTLRGATNHLCSNTTDLSSPYSGSLTAFNSNGFSLGVDAGGMVNKSGSSFVSWTFRKAPKFFDVVTYTGNNGVARTISHSLGQAPGMIIVKCVTSGGNWYAYHRSIGESKYTVLNTTAAEVTDTTLWNNTAPTSSVFSLGTSALANNNGDTFVAYLFAHDPSADGIIQCGSFTTDASGNATVNLGWEPQYVLEKPTTGAYAWELRDTSRGYSYSAEAYLSPSNANAEAIYASPQKIPNATGFTIKAWLANQTVIYLAIRRPNKPPTTGTEVYNAIARTGTGAAATVTGVGFAPDLAMIADRAQGSGNVEKSFIDRLRGSRQQLVSNTSATESAFGADAYVMGMDGATLPAGYGAVNGSGGTYINHFFKRAPGFFDVVCYTGTGVARTVPHSLGVAPELMIVKRRSGTGEWTVYHKDLGVAGDKVLYLSGNYYAGQYTGNVWNNAVPTPSVFSLTAGGNYNSNSETHVVYLFATLLGISKVGSYTGNGTTQTINCGFTTGARFILIKRTDSTGDWYVWDTARGIVSANDPHLSLNTTAAEVTTDDSVDPASSGFIVNQVAATNINVSAASYIYFSVA